MADASQEPTTVSQNSTSLNHANSSQDDKSNGSKRQSPSSVTEEIDEACCCPIGCSAQSEPIDPDNQDDFIVKVICSNVDCKLRPFMHKVCFETWESKILQHHIKITGKAKGWSDKQIHQTLWTKKGSDIACKACECKCGHGHLRKDTTATNRSAAANVDEKKRRRKKSGPLLSSALSKNTCASNNTGGSNENGAGGSCQNNNNYSSSGGSAVGPRIRSRTLSLGSAAGLFSTGSPHVPPTLARCLAKRSTGFSSESDFFTDTQVKNSGSIFRHRESMTALFENLPRWKRNGIHIKMEDDCPQGNDETRIFVLTNLGDKKMRDMICILCRCSMPVYDRYPLIDGTFFLSPINHANLGVRVKHDGKDGYVLAICVVCLENSSRFACRRCGSQDLFPGDRLVVGTLYSFDVLAAKACCPPCCGHCRKTLPLPPTVGRHFSRFSELSVCPNCGHSDLHFIRRLETIKNCASQIVQASA